MCFRKRGEPIEVCQGQKELALKIIQPGCTGAQLLDMEVELVLFAPPCPGDLLKSPQVWTGCLLSPARTHPQPGPHTLPPIAYNAFRVDDDGRIVFYLDDLFLTRPPGRYIGKVVDKRGRQIVEIDIDLCTKPWIVADIGLNHEIVCGG